MERVARTIRREPGAFRSRTQDQLDSRCHPGRHRRERRRPRAQGAGDAGSGERATDPLAAAPALASEMGLLCRRRAQGTAAL